MQLSALEALEVPFLDNRVGSNPRVKTKLDVSKGPGLRIMHRVTGVRNHFNQKRYLGGKAAGLLLRDLPLYEMTEIKSCGWFLSHHNQYRAGAQD